MSAANMDLMQQQQQQQQQPPMQALPQRRARQAMSRLFTVLVSAAAVAMLPRAARACCKASKPDPTFVSADEYNIDGISPDRGPIHGGGRVTISGDGFNTNFFEAGNYVYM